MKRLIPIVLVFTLFGCGSKPEADTTVKKDSVPKPPQKVDSVRKGLIYPKLMTLVRKSAFDDLYIRIKDTVYSCNYKGKFQSADSSGTVNHFLFDLKAEYLIDVAYFWPISQNEFFVNWQETDHKGIYTYYGVYSRGNNTPVWKRVIKAPSPGQPVIDSADVYISSLGMIGKFELNSGKVIWQYDSLFDQTNLKYKQFDRPVLYNHTACFFDFPIKGRKNRRDTIWVNENSGKLVR